MAAHHGRDCLDVLRLDERGHAGDEGLQVRVVKAALVLLVDVSRMCTLAPSNLPNGGSRTMPHLRPGRATADPLDPSQLVVPRA